MYELFFVLGVLIVGIITSYTDIKFGKIRNNILLFGLIYAIVLNLIIFFIIENINPRAYLHYFTNAIFMLVVCFILWYVGLWTAGDSKLFFIFNLLVPPFFITEYYLGYFYGLVFFINIFGIMFFYFIYKIITNLKKSEFLYSIKKTFVPRNLVGMLLFVFGFGLLFRYLPQGLSKNFFLSVFMIFLVYSIIESVFENKVIIALVGLVLVRIVLEFSSLLTVRFWLNFLLQFASLLFLRLVLLRLSYFAFTKRIKIIELKEKMFLAEDIVPVKIIEMNEERKKQMLDEKESFIKFQKQKIENLTFIAYLQNKYFKHFDYDKNLGLSEENLEWFRKNKKNILFKSIRVYDTMPFAPLISIGVLLTILIKGNVFLTVINLFR